MRVLDGGYVAGERSLRHLERLRRRRIAWWIVAALVWVALVCVVLAALDVPPLAIWPTGHQLRTAGLELDARWAAAVHDAMGADGLGLARLGPVHVAAALNRMVGADPAAPVVAVTLGQGTVEVCYRLHGPLGIRPVLTLVLRPSLLEDTVFCAVDRASLGSCPLPLVMWCLAARQEDGEAGWQTRDGAVGYTWPASITTGTDPVSVGGIACGNGVLEITLCGAR